MGLSRSENEVVVPPGTCGVKAAGKRVTVAVTSAITRKVPRHDQMSPTQAPKGTPVNNATVKPAVTIDRNLPSRPEGARLPAMAMAVGLTALADMPAITRSTRASQRLFTTTISPLAIANISSPPTRTFFLSYLSVATAMTGDAMQNANANAVTNNPT